MQGNAMLFSEMIPDPAWEREFNDWYDTEHIPLRMGAPGFFSAQRYCISDTRNYLAVYEMDSPGALKTPEYQVIKGQPNERTQRMLAGVKGFTRYIGEQISDQRRADLKGEPLDTPYLYVVWFNVPRERQREFNQWYTEEHVPILLKCTDWLACRRFRIIDGEPEPWTHLALHYLVDPRALESPERAEARATPWRDKLSKEPWFKAKYSVFPKHGARQFGRSA